MILERYRPLIVAGLARAAGRDGRLGLLVRYPLGLSEPDGAPGPGIGGKLLRPSLVLFSCEALGGDVQKALPLACALELGHNFSLVHDDIQDGDELRRGRPTVWKAFGLGQAINSGDVLLVLAFATALSTDLAAETTVMAQRTLLAATLRMIEGQILDLAAEGQDPGVEGYFRLAQAKTGALFGCAMELGALAAGKPELAEPLRALGEEVGLAFQIRDDILGIWGEPEKTRKPVGNDLLRRKRSFPISYALSREPSLRELLAAPAGRVGEILARLEAVGARRAAEEEVQRRLAQAAQRARTLPWPGWAQAAFAELLEFLREREA